MGKVKLDNGRVFERYETKYLLTARQYEELCQALAARTTADDYGLHTIISVYYDTPDYRIIEHCLDKPKFREKLRLRSYGVPKPWQPVYLELKKKFAGITYKRRLELSLHQAEHYLAGQITAGNKNQILGEIDWFISQHEDLAPRVLIAYDRLARTDNEDPNLRITCDANLSWRDYDLSPSQGVYGEAVLPPGVRIMEIKTMDALPCWLTALLSELRIFPTSFSKYGTIFREFLTKKEEASYAV